MKDELTTLSRISLPSNNLINISLMQRINTKPNDFKDKLFAFISAIPGQKTGSSAIDRTYVFDQAISLKFSLHELCAFAFALKQLGKHNFNILPYVKFSKNNNISKSVSIWISQNKKSKSDSVIISVSEGSIKHNVGLSLSDAYALGKRCDILFEFGMKKDCQIQANANQNRTYNNLSTDKSIEFTN